MSATPAPRRDEERPEYIFPCAPEAEQTILAATLQAGSMKHAEDLSPEEFYDATRRRIFAAMRDLDRRGDLIPDKLKAVLTKDEPPDLKAEESIAWRVDTLNLAEVGPLSLLPRKVAEIKNMALKRGMMLWHLDSAKALNAGELDVPEHVKDVRALGEKWEATPSSDTKPVSARLEEIYESILTDKTKPVPTFSAALNKNLSGGLRRGEVLTIAAPAGAGKTTFILQLAEETAREQVKRAGADSTVPPCALVYVSAEMSEKELVTKSLSRLGRVDSCRIRDKSIGAAALEPAMKRYAAEVAPVMYLVQARDGMTLDEVRGITRKVKTRLAEAVRGTAEDLAAEDPFVILCVDPFQRLLTGNPAIDSEEISRVGALGSGLKKLARDLDVSVILAADTTKDVARRTAEGSGPGVAPIRGSYMATHTTDYEAAIVTWESEEAGELNEKLKKKFQPLVGGYSIGDFDECSLPAYAVLSFSKNRFGLCEPCPFMWERAYNRFVPIGEEQERDSGGTKGSLLERWEVKPPAAGGKAYPHKRRATGGK